MIDDPNKEAGAANPPVAPEPAQPARRQREAKPAADRGASRAFSAPTAPTPQGLTTIVWGTGTGLAMGSAFTTMICVDFEPEPNVDLPTVENCDGFTASRIPIRDGFNSKASFVYDSALTWPADDAEVLVKWPLYPNGLYHTVMKRTLKRSRKKETMIDYELQNRPGINTAAP